MSSPAVACPSSIVGGRRRPWGIVVVEADVGRAALFVRLRVFGTPSPFLGILRTFPPCHRSPQIGHTLGLSIPSVTALLRKKIRDKVGKIWSTATNVQLRTIKVIKFDNLRTRIFIKILTSDSEPETSKASRNGVASIFPRFFGCAKFLGIFNAPKSLSNQPSLDQFCTMHDPDVVDV